MFEFGVELLANSTSKRRRDSSSCKSSMFDVTIKLLFAKARLEKYHNYDKHKILLLISRILKSTTPS